LVDPREQDPLAFTNLASEPGSLTTGGYSIKGLEHLIAVERKSLPDLLACCGRERDRFKRELQRLRAYRFRLLVVETDAAEIEAGEWVGKMVPNQIMGSLAAWQAQFGLPVWLAGDHEAAGRFVERFLYQAARCVALEAEAVGQRALNARTEAVA
jgi:ERCC4-type nuclease